MQGVGKRFNEYNNNQGRETKRQHMQEKYPNKVILPVFESSGLLELESHGKEGIQLKHVEPRDAIAPIDFYEKYSIPVRKRTRFLAMLYKDDKNDALGQYELLERSSYLIGRSKDETPGGDSPKSDPEDSSEEKQVVLADIPVPEETCSKQHCVIQFRNVADKLIPYVIDLDSANGTVLNDVALPHARYVELKSGDILRFSEHEEDSMFSIVFVAA